MIPSRLVWVMVAALALQAFPAQAAVTVKLATLAPDGSPWHEILKDMAASWQEVSDGKVRVKIYAGGVVGDELDVLRKMGGGVMQAAAFTSVGLAGITPATRALMVPRLVRSDAELDAVLAAIGPELEQLMAAEGVVVLGWADAGWVHFFLPRKLTAIHDVMKVKLFAWAGDDDALRLWKQTGFNVVPLPATEIMTGLQTGLIDAFDTPPAVALASQWFSHTPYMLELKWAPLTGALVITQDAWRRIPEGLRPALKREAEKAARRMREESARLNREAVEAMTRRGLKLATPSPEEVAEWDKVTAAAYPKLKDGYVDPELFEKVAAASRSRR